MLNIGCFQTRSCQGMTRRSFLQVGALGVFGLTLPDFLAQRAAGAAMEGRAKSVILLWLWGGPSHFETFDPKPDAPSGIRGPFGVIATKAPGIHVCELFPQTATLADQLAVIRSLNHDQSDHNVGGTVALTGVPAGGRIGGGTPVPGVRKPTLGSLVARLKGMQPGQLPPFLTIGPPCLVSMTPLSGQDAAGLGAAYDPFRVEYPLEDGVKMPSSFQLPREVSLRRLQDRRRLLTQLDALERKVEQATGIGKMNGFYTKLTKVCPTLRCLKKHLVGRGDSAAPIFRHATEGVPYHAHDKSYRKWDKLLSVEYMSRRSRCCSPRLPRKPLTSKPRARNCATATGAQGSGSRAFWRGGWSKSACRSFRSTGAPMPKTSIPAAATAAGTGTGGCLNSCRRGSRGFWTRLSLHC